MLFAVGFLTPLAAFAMATVMLNAIESVHWKNGFFAGKGGYEFNLQRSRSPSRSHDRRRASVDRPRARLGRQHQRRRVGHRCVGRRGCGLAHHHGGATQARACRLGTRERAGSRPALSPSGCPDLNWGPLRPERSALPGCATPRGGVRLATFPAPIRDGSTAMLSLRQRDGGRPKDDKTERTTGGDVNVVTLIGNLATDIELKELPRQEGGDVPARRRPAARGRGLRRRRDLGQAGGSVREYLSKGVRIAVDGRLRSRSWEDADGKPAERGRGGREPGSSSSTAPDAKRRRPSRHGRARSRSSGVARRDDIVAFADDLLAVEAFPEYGRPGLQVLGADEVTKIACGVSSSLELFERAAAAGAQLCSCHHGLFWRNEPLVVDRRLKGRLEVLFAGDVTLARVPPRVGRAPGGRQQRAARRRASARRARDAFAEIGAGARLDEPVTIDKLIARLRDATGRDPLAFAPRARTGSSGSRSSPAAAGRGSSRRRTKGTTRW